MLDPETTCHDVSIKKQHQKQQLFLDPSKPAGQEDDENKEDDEEEEDPLDAFMKTLDSTKTKSDEEKKRKQQRCELLAAFTHFSGDEDSEISFEEFQQVLIY